MKVSVKLLKQLGNIPASNEDIVKAIKTHIGEVEDSHNIEEDYENIVVAEIVDKRDHPDADKLGVYQVDFGGSQPVQVLAGDKTLEVGDKVAYLKPEAKVPYTIYTEEKPLIIQSMKMRGLISNGMMGSEKELNIGSDHTKVMRLDQSAKVGESFAEYFDLDDFVIDIENKALTNRGDLFGLIGLARELTAILGNSFVSPDWYKNKSKDIKPETNCLELNITNDAEALCKRYMAIAIDNVLVQESPVWLKSSIVKLGYKPINNVVDITNYISHLVGQPLHAFDYDKVVRSGDPAHKSIAQINIRMAREGESLLGLDNKVHELNENVMVIANDTHPMAIAGIIGGSETEVDMNTSRIIIESANFDKTNIRKTSMMLGINTEAGTKFKHSLDPEQCLIALKQTVGLVKELAGGKIASEIIDIYNAPYPAKYISLSMSKLNQHLGTSLTSELIKDILVNLEYKIEKEEDDIITVLVPSWRRDVEIKEDIHEDIGRIYGYNNIEPVIPQRPLVPAHDNNIYALKKMLRQLLSDSGCNETDTYNFVSMQTLKNCNLDSDLAYTLKNPLAPELSLMRTSILPSLLVKTQDNLQRGFEKFGLFEFNIPHVKGVMDEDGLPKEEWHLSMVITDIQKKVDSSYYLAKVYIERILHTLGIEKVNVLLLADAPSESLSPDIKNTSYIFDPNTSALIYIQDILVGIMGEIDNKVKSNFKLPSYTCALDLNINILSTLKEERKMFVDISRYPTSSVDLCFKINTLTKYGDISKDIIKIINTDNLQGNIECLDRYGEKNDADHLKTTFRVKVKSMNKTLTDKDIDAITEKIERKLANSYNAQLI
jgi:phenylalanyl-tRNA synthetase beta chain